MLRSLFLAERFWPLAGSAMAQARRIPVRWRRKVQKRRVEKCISALRAARVVQIDVEEFHMKKILIQYGVCALAVALMLPLAQAHTPY